MDQPQPILVRGRCACGKRYRIRNAQPGITVMCPNCRRAIPITDADLRAALADARLIPVQSETAEPLEVIPVDVGELTLAPEGSRPGLTGEKAFEHEEVMLARAVRGSLTLGETYDELNPPPAAGPCVLIEFEPGREAFVHDLFASFYCAGIPGNALNILVIAVACSLVVALQYVLVFLGPFLLFMIPLYGIVFLYVVQFYWSVLRITAGGEDEIPWAQTDWSFWHDGFKPLIWMTTISLLCSLPAMLLGWYGLSGVTVGWPAWWLALGAGWFFWPVAVMSVALGNTILFVRPDWLIRCVIGIGPVYLVAWLAVMIAIAGWYAFWQFAGIWIWIPVLGFAVNLYLGYVVFRALGLLFRHFRERFPWKY
ncbi:MAG: hypothetical protein ACE5I3_05730 [Phycisphaerae bacterium]